jgi:UDP-N-acetylglucosamine--N-acetylmuramyl-(pentapeptide) pyrophosphoryl-undecaprenol N-acetylglucosamine transferase
MEFHDRMEELYAVASLVVSRAGGSFLAEFTAVGLPMLLVPGTFAGAHQLQNAEPLQKAGAAVVVPDAELSGQRLLNEIRRLADDAGFGRLAAMARASREFGRPGAAATVARMLLELA